MLVDFHWSAPWGSLGSSGDAGFTGEPPGGRRAHPGWLRSLGYTVGSCGSSVVHPGSLGSLKCALGVVGLIQCWWFLWVAPLGSLGTFGDADFTEERHRVLREHLGLLGSQGCNLKFIGIIRGH